MRKSRHNSYFIPFLLAALVLLLYSSLLATPALAGIKFAPFEAIRVDVAPGETITHKMTVTLVETDQPVDMVVDVMGFGNSPDGSAQELEASKDTSLYSARSFITIDNPLFHMEPGEPQDFIATIDIPSDVGEGGRYAIIRIHQIQPPGVRQLGTLSAFNIPVYLTIKDSQLIHKGEITGVSAGETVSGQPVDIFTTFQNTGNHHFKTKGEVTISDAQGQVLDTIHVALSQKSVLPTMSRQLKAIFIPAAELPLGVYSVKSKLMLEDGVILDEAEGNFEVKEPYVPPPSPASLIVTPASAAVLQTPDGAISISFPKGAVISQVEISLRSYPLEQLPSAPADFDLATTCFRIDGLTGLLLKEATVTVKYTPADLDKAEGDASRLRLARWDEADNQWSVLNTTVNKEATTLTTNTNQLSIWAVMVAAQAGVNWILIAGVVAGVIIIALLIFLLVRRRAY